MRPADLDVLIVGPYPPPLGGISLHVRRLSAALTERGLRVGVLNHFGHRRGAGVVAALHRNPVLYFLALRRRAVPVVHYHHARLSTLVAAALAPRRDGTSYIATIHDHSLERYLRVTALASLTRWALRRFDEIVAVSPEVGRGLESAVGRARVTVIPAYLPAGGEPRVALPAPVDEFLGRPGRTLVVSAYGVSPSRSGANDAYGLEVAVEAFLRLATGRADLRLAVFLALEPKRRRATRYLDGLMERVEGAGKRDRVALHVGVDLAPAFAHDVVYLRPSRADGDAVSVREALAAGTPVIASDVVRRPPGTHVVRGLDGATWCAAIESALAGARVEPPEPPPANGALQAMLDLYSRRLPAEALARMKQESSA